MARLVTLSAILFCLIFSSAQASFHGSAVSIVTGQSEVVPNSMNAELPLLDFMKTNSQQWIDNTSNAILKPTDLDATGMPIPGRAWVADGGAITFISLPSPFVASGHYRIASTGQGIINIGSVPITAGSCTGVLSGTTCDNTGCSTFTASASGNTLTVISAPTGTGCTLGAGVPVTGTGLSLSTFGIPVFITSAGTTCGSNICYSLNVTGLSISSEAMSMGMRFDFTITANTQQDFETIEVNLKASQSGNPLQNLSLVFVSDEANYWNARTPCGSGQGCIIGSLFKTRMQQGNFASMRDLNFEGGASVMNCSTWDTRKPINYFSYTSPEFRNAPSGTTTYVAGGHTYTIPKQGQYVDAAGDGASGGTVSYNAGADIYSVTLNTGNLVDKQTFEVLIPTTGTASSKLSMNSNTAVPILSAFGTTPGSGPQATQIITFFYDQDIGGVLSTEVDNGLSCGMPPEVFIEINAELKTNTWHVLPFLALDPMTDWTSQYATYEKSVYSPPAQTGVLGPIFESTNEPFSCSVNAPIYMSVKSTAHINADTNHAWVTGGVTAFCSSNGNNASETGKMAATVGQDIHAVYGSAAEVLIPVQTATLTSSWLDAIQSAAYIGQSMAPQIGYTQVAAYTNNTRISVNNYWNTGYNGAVFCQNSVFGCTAGTEVGIAYCYFYFSISTPCQGLYANQAAAMAAKMNSASLANAGGVADFTIPYLVTQLSGWKTIGLNCAEGSRPGNCTINATAPLMMYEGGFDESEQPTDVTQSISSAANASNAVLTTVNNAGCVTGQTVALSSLSGGTWSTAAGSYTVVSGTATTCTINLNSTGLGTLSGATLTYTGSANYVNVLRQSTFLQASLDTLTTTVYNDVIANGGSNPSQFNMAGSFAVIGGWYVFAPNNYGNYPMGQCSACTIAGTTLTLGGTITSLFQTGQILAGGFLATPNTILGACTPVGANVCGTTAGDTFALSQSSTISAGQAMQGLIPAPTNFSSTGTTSPVRQFGAICRWNNNANACNG